MQHVQNGELSSRFSLRFRHLANVYTKPSPSRTAKFALLTSHFRKNTANSACGSRKKISAVGRAHTPRVPKGDRIRRSASSARSSSPVFAFVGYLPRASLPVHKPNDGAIVWHAKDADQPNRAGTLQRLYIESLGMLNDENQYWLHERYPESNPKVGASTLRTSFKIIRQQHQLELFGDRTVQIR